MVLKLSEVKENEETNYINILSELDNGIISYTEFCDEQSR